MGISGTTKAPLHALFGPDARFGASRFGGHDGRGHLKVAGTFRTASGVPSSLGINEQLDHDPNTATITFENDFTPAKGDAVIITVGSQINSTKLFGGRILSTQKAYRGNDRSDVVWHCNLVDPHWELNQKRVRGQYLSQDASLIIKDLFTNFAAEFTVVGVDSSLGTIDEITFTEETFSTAMTRIMQRVGGYWYIDYSYDCHAFLADASDPPTDLTDSHTSLRGVALTEDLSQIATRVMVEGQGSTTLETVEVSQTTIPVVDTAPFSGSGGSVKMLGGQIAAYTGLIASGGAGSFASSTSYATNPLWHDSAPLPVTRTWRSCAYAEGVGYVAVGQTRDSALSTDGKTWAVTTDALPSSGSNVWTEVVYADSLSLFVAVEGGGTSSTVRAATSANGTSWTQRTTPTGGNDWSCLAWSEDDTLLVACALNTAKAMTSPDGITWTERSMNIAGSTGVAFCPSISLFVAVQNPASTSNVETSPDGITWTQRTSAIASGMGAVTWSEDLTLAVAVPNGVGPEAQYSADGTNWTATTTFPNGNGDVIWMSERTRFVATNRSTDTTFSVSADGITWTEENAASTANRYGLAWAPTLKLLVSVGDIASMSYQEMDHQDVAVADTTIHVLDLSKFSATGGWLSVADQFVRYTGRSASTGEGTLTGVPASGVGSVVTAIPTGSEILPVGTLTGVTGVLVEAPAGESVNIYITRNDASAQSTLATLLGGSADGIFEHYIQDRRLSQTECEARGDAVLALLKTAISELSYTCRDPKTRVGKTLTVDLSSPQSIDTTFKIQRILISEVETHGKEHQPLRRVTASTARFSFEDMLRQIRESTTEA